jgi:hypothetical protein
MSPRWKAFLIVRFPVAILAFLAVFQLVGMALSNVPLRRFETDSLPDAIVRDPSTHQMLVFGDSTAGNVLRKYRVGQSEQVLNLATHAHIGLAGSVLMLRRYLETHAPPKYVLFIVTPGFFAVPQDPRKLHYYTWNVFRKSGEHAFLKTLYGDIDADEWKPAAMNVQQKIIEPLFSLLQKGPAKLYPPGADPDPDAPLEPATMNVASEKVIQERIAEQTDLAKPAEIAIHEICSENRADAFRIGIAWAPAPPEVVAHWRETKGLEKLQNQIRAAMGQHCGAVDFFNFNDAIAYPVFDHVALHLRGSGWEQRFATQIRAHIEDLLGYANRENVMTRK